MATALDSVNQVRTEWLPYDLMLASGITVEIKSAAYLQTWKQTTLSKIRFDIKPKKSWDPATNEFSDKSQRNANVYVFCLLAEKNQSNLDPLDLNQWEFYVVGTKVLNDKLGGQGSMGLSTLRRFEPIVVSYSGLDLAVELASQSQS